MVPDRIEQERIVDAPAERVWDFVTKGEHLGRWFADAGATVDLRPGGAIELVWKDSGVTKAVVERVEPPTTFAFRWTNYGDEVNPGNSTLVTFTLTAETADRTRVTVVETGFADLDIPGLDRRRHHDLNTAGWEAELGHLVDYAQR